MECDTPAIKESSSPRLRLPKSLTQPVGDAIRLFNPTTSSPRSQESDHRSGGFVRNKLLRLARSATGILTVVDDKEDGATPSPKMPLSRSRSTMSRMSDGSSCMESEGDEGDGQSMWRRRLKFNDIDKAQAIKLVRKGEILAKKDDVLGPTRWTHWVTVLRSFWRGRGINEKEFYFVIVMEDEQPWRAELRWGITQEVATGSECDGRLLLSEINYVTATILRDEDAEMLQAEHFNTRKHRQLRIVCASRTLKLCAPSRESMKIWVTALVQLAHEAQGSAHRKRRAPDHAVKAYIQRLFAHTDNKKEGTLSVERMAQLIPKINMNVGIEYLEELVEEFDKDDTDGLNLDEFCEFFQMFTIKDALMYYWQKYAKQYSTTKNTFTRHLMSAERFMNFLELEQGESGFFGNHIGIKGRRGLFGMLREPHIEVIGSERLLTEAGFSHLMCCAENTLFDPMRRARVSQNMDRPLSHYWIASSHNTYLEGHQLVGESSLNQYIEVLMDGCRCVEIDCWDGEAGEPVVTHGYTMTSKIFFKDVIRICRDYGFAVTPYPLILSLEVHCNPEQRERMGQILRDILGDMLLLHPGELEDQRLTSPASARNKIIVKAKIPKDGNLEKKNSFAGKDLKPDRACSRSSLNSKRSSDTKITKDLKSSGGTQSNYASSGTQSSGGTQSSTKSFSSRCLCSGNSKQKFPRIPTASSAETNQSDLDDDEIFMNTSTDMRSIYSTAIYMATVKIAKKNFKKDGLPTDTLPAPTCASFNERAARLFIDSYGTPAVRLHHRERISRAYPHRTRVGSDNFDPFPMWLAGFQIVALNYQSLDLPMLLNDGLFTHENGGCGYVLKPPSVRRSFDTAGGCKNPQSPRTEQDQMDAAASGLTIQLELTVLSGHWLPKPEGFQAEDVITPVVRVSLCGAREDQYVAETRCISKNGFNPYWNERFVFDILHADVAMLAFEVFHVGSDGKRCFVAANAFPVSGLRQGIRWVPLLDWRHHTIEMCGLLVESRPRGEWSELRKQQRWSQGPVEVDCVQLISSGPGGLEDPNFNKDRKEKRKQTRAATLASKASSEQSALTTSSDSQNPKISDDLIPSAKSKNSGIFLDSEHEVFDEQQRPVPHIGRSGTFKFRTISSEGFALLESAADPISEQFDGLVKDEKSVPPMPQSGAMGYRSGVTCMSGMLSPRVKLKEAHADDSTSTPGGNSSRTCSRSQAGTQDVEGVTPDSRDAAISVEVPARDRPGTASALGDRQRVSSIAPPFVPKLKLDSN